MEVHAHTHTARKKWTHYLWEFLMLFLAVFCGFLAEDQREHMVEHQRERQYIKTCVADLQLDTIQAISLVYMEQNIFKGMDSLMTALKAPDAIEKPEAINRYFGYAKDDIQFVTVSRTMQQLKNSGNMRLIRKTNVSDSLTQYDLYQQFLSTKYEVMSDTRKEVLNLLDEIVDENTTIYSTVINRDMLAVASQNTILTKDRYKLDILFNKLKRLKGQQMDYSNRVKFVYDFASSLIPLIQKEYHLK